MAPSSSDTAQFVCKYCRIRQVRNEGFALGATSISLSCRLSHLGRVSIHTFFASLSSSVLSFFRLQMRFACAGTLWTIPANANDFRQEAYRQTLATTKGVDLRKVVSRKDLSMYSFQMFGR